MQPGRQVAAGYWSGSDAMPVSVPLVDNDRSSSREIGFWPPTDFFQRRVDNGLLDSGDRRPV
ncbi:hypothetical protein M0655_23325 (plasmid) [Gordonia amicalis]|uniref:hypothetical protein n=1 Tax=Gordonia TaxID=2053 RepID=UPI0012F8E47A|nr:MULTISPECIES: hypothetical protein [Gordonia]MBA5846301.1 hypothetical protein [Gordonia amicalis]MDH3026210.1 hypothetical protein [Gordonia alkanivorans]NKX79852.1 hypothetical protein [Gordonia amicalis]UOG23690.1 hypothetical protein MTX80_22540 [Gordonia amicalis]UPW16435.1 hypothetical protein M0655_23325 [Gordonia amicalis]